MPKRKEINKVLVIGSGPIVIGQAAEFDYAGTQACLALKEEGCEVILCNSNPATIMTDTSIADKVYMEPLTLEYIAKVLRHERPDAILPGIGGQTGLNLAMQLDKKGILAECRTILLGTPAESIERAEDRLLFKELCESLGEPVVPSEIAHSMEEGLEAARRIGFPLVLRPAFTLGGTGGGFAENEKEFRIIMKHALELSPVRQVLVEKSIRGFKEIEYEVMRDSNDTAITICNMENLDPVGVHTGDSIVVCPSQTLTNKEYHMLRDSALRVIRALKIEGGCNVQFALDPCSFQYYLIEVNPRVSRSSALASKASGYPIARVSAKIGIGMTLDEIMLANTPACFEPALDYIVTKMPRFAFEKYQDPGTPDLPAGTQDQDPETPKLSAGMQEQNPETSDLPAGTQEQNPETPKLSAGMQEGEAPGSRGHRHRQVDNTLSTQMKATGEVMSIGRTMEESLLKAVRSLETKHMHLYDPVCAEMTDGELWDYIREARDDRIYAIAQLLRTACSDRKAEAVRKADAVREVDAVRKEDAVRKAEEVRETEAGICRVTGIDAFFIHAVRRIVMMENELSAHAGDAEFLYKAKRMGFSDREIGELWNMKEEQIFSLRLTHGIMPVYKMIDSCASEFDSYIPYFYSTYEDENEAFGKEISADGGQDQEEKQKIIVLGSGPIRIGQGVEFDYSSVHAVQTIRRAGFEAIIINNNPETVSTDYTCSDKLYFEPLCVEDVMNVILMEKPAGVIATLGGQTAINLALPLRERGVRIIGTDCDAIDRAENRDLFEKLLEEKKIPQPKGRAVTSIEEGMQAARDIGFPVLVRPSFVLGGRAMQIVGKEEELEVYLRSAVEIGEDKPVLVDQYIRGREVEVDAVCDGRHVFVPGIMELVERTGVHSGDSISVYPPYSLSEGVKETILDYAGRLGTGIGIRGLFNIQFIVDEREQVYIIEVNPRSSRTVPFLSKATGWSLADIATLVSLGISLEEQGITGDGSGSGKKAPDVRKYSEKQEAAEAAEAAEASEAAGGRPGSRLGSRPGVRRSALNEIVFYSEEKERFYVKVPVFSFSKLHGMDAYLSPEMKSTGEAIGYDRKLHRAVYKAMTASGLRVRSYGTVIVSVADEDKMETIPLIQRFYEMGFNIEATTLTGEYLREAGIRTRIRHKPSEGSEEVLDVIRTGFVSYVINTRAVLSGVHYGDGVRIRECAAQNNAVMLTSLDTVRMLLDVLEEVTFGILTIDGK